MTAAMGSAVLLAFLTFGANEWGFGGKYNTVWAHTLDSKMASFIVTGESRDTVSVELPHHKAKCVFDYVAGQPAHESKKVPETARINAQDVLTRLKGQCAQGQSGYWTYQVCLGGEIKQFHGQDSYKLGKFSHVEGKILKYDKGLPCDPPSNPTERQVDVSLACSDKMGVQLISEPSTCKYTMTLVLPNVCSDPSYPKMMQTAGAKGKAPDDGHEDWILQIRESDDGKVICSSHSTETRLAGSRLSFRSFSLKVEKDKGSYEKVKGSARAMGRVPLSDTELVVSSESISHGSGFGGKLAYVDLEAT
ncbi:hypothetical protein AAMO2058_001360200 [Amorphochlora amoebiformis]